MIRLIDRWIKGFMNHRGGDEGLFSKECGAKKLLRKGNAWWEDSETVEKPSNNCTVIILLIMSVHFLLPLLPSPPGLLPPVQLQTAGLPRDLRPAQALVGLHLGLLLLGDPLSRLARGLLRTLMAGHRPPCPPGLTAHPQVCPGEWKHERSLKRTSPLRTNVFYSVFQSVFLGH